MCELAVVWYYVSVGWDVLWSLGSPDDTTMPWLTE